MVIKFLIIGRWFRKHHMGVIAHLIDYVIIRGFYSCDVQSNMKIGEGVIFAHNGLGVVIHPQTIIGNNVKIMQGVTVGGRDGSALPIIEDDVLIGAGAKVLGEIRIGRGAKIGANSVVLKDVPEGCTAVGVPARILQSKH